MERYIGWFRVKRQLDYGEIFWEFWGEEATASWRDILGGLGGKRQLDQDKIC